MGEISELLQNKVGLGPEQSQEAEKLILDLVISKVPTEFQGALGSVLGAGSAQGQPAESGGLGGLLNAAEGLFGNKG